jgi:hypothetical protein
MRRRRRPRLRSRAADTHHTRDWTAPLAYRRQCLGVGIDQQTLVANSMRATRARGHDWLYRSLSFTLLVNQPFAVVNSKPIQTIIWLYEMLKCLKRRIAKLMPIVILAPWAKVHRLISKLLYGVIPRER